MLGAVRALTVRIWTSNSWVVRQGTWLTMGLWVVSLGLHFIGGVGAQHVGAGSLEASSFLLYLGVTYGVQNAVVHRRAAPLWDALGPEAGQRVQINFGQGPGGSGAFFATFRGGGRGLGRGSGRGPGTRRGTIPPSSTPRWSTTTRGPRSSAEREATPFRSKGHRYPRWGQLLEALGDDGGDLGADQFVALEQGVAQGLDDVSVCDDDQAGGGT